MLRFERIRAVWQYCHWTAAPIVCTKRRIPIHVVVDQLILCNQSNRRAKSICNTLIEINRIVWRTTCSGSQVNLLGASEPIEEYGPKAPDAWESRCRFLGFVDTPFRTDDQWWFHKNDTFRWNVTRCHHIPTQFRWMLNTKRPTYNFMLGPVRFLMLTATISSCFAGRTFERRRLATNHTFRIDCCHCGQYDFRIDFLRLSFRSSNSIPNIDRHGWLAHCHWCAQNSLWHARCTVCARCAMKIHENWFMFRIRIATITPSHFVYFVDRIVFIFGTPATYACLRSLHWPTCVKRIPFNSFLRTQNIQFLVIGPNFISCCKAQT